MDISFEQNSYRKIETGRGSKFVNLKVKKVLLKYNTILLTILKCHNNPYKYILLAISAFSRYSYAIPMHSKRCEEITRTLESIFGQDSYRKVHTDRGCKFINSLLKMALLKYHTILYHNHSPIKAALAECLKRKPHRPLSNHSPLEVHHANNTLDIF